MKTDCHLRVKMIVHMLFMSTMRIKRSTAVIQSGIYHCDIPVNGSGRGTVYVGLYETGGIIQY